MASQSCNSVDILGQGDHCSFVKEMCTGKGIFNFYYLHYCQLYENLIVTSFIAILIMFLSFHYQCTTTGIYFAPLMTKLTKSFPNQKIFLTISILAISNCAPCIVTSVNASFDQKNGVFICMGLQLGSTMFSTTIIIGKCISNAPNSEIIIDTLGHWMKDFVFYIATVLLVQIFSVLGYIDFTLIACFWAIYIAYTTITVANFYRNKKKYFDINSLNDSMDQNPKLKAKSTKYADSIIEYLTYFIKEDIKQKMNIYLRGEISTNNDFDEDYATKCKLRIYQIGNKQNRYFLIFLSKKTKIEDYY